MILILKDLEGMHQPKPTVAICDTKVLVKPKIFSVLKECFFILASESEKKAKKSENHTCLLTEFTRIHKKAHTNSQESSHEFR
jgi:hypothetical protein